MSDSSEVSESEKLEEDEDFFMALAELTSKQSRDPVTQVGACIVDDKGRVIGVGFNGFPRGCSDDEFPWGKKDSNKLNRKKWYVAHAEMNAILNKNLMDISGTRIYTTLFPCGDCARLIVRSGIKEVIFISELPDGKGGYSKAIFESNNIKFRQFVRKGIVIDLPGDCESRDQMSFSSPKRLKYH